MYDGIIDEFREVCKYFDVTCKLNGSNIVITKIKDKDKYKEFLSYYCIRSLEHYNNIFNKHFHSRDELYTYLYNRTMHYEYVYANDIGLIKKLIRQVKLKIILGK